MVTVKVLVSDGSEAIFKSGLLGWVIAWKGKTIRSEAIFGKRMTKASYFTVKSRKIYVREILEVIP
jgi:hypothetical protein